MRVLHVNKYVYRRGGAEAYMLDLADLQRGSGHEVAIFGMAHPENPRLPFEDLFPSYLELNPPPRDALGRARALGTIMYSVPARRRMAEVIRRFRPDVVHAHNVYQHLSPSVISAAVAAGVPVVMTLHDFKLVCPSYLMLDHGRVCEACIGGGLRQPILRRCKDDSILASAVVAAETALHRRAGFYEKVSAVICPSRFLKSRIESVGLFQGRLHQLPNFVPPATAASVEQRPGTVACVSRLSHEKGVDVLVEAAPFTRHVRAIEIAGDGPERAELEARSRALDGPAIRFRGRIDRQDVAELVASSAVVAAPSRCYENQPLAVLEAFLHARPVVGSDLGGLAELIEGGSDGLLVAPDDPRALARALDAIVSEPRLADAMGRRGLARATTTFSPDRHGAELDEVYRQVVNRTMGENRGETHPGRDDRSTRRAGHLRGDRAARRGDRSPTG